MKTNIGMFEFQTNEQICQRDNCKRDSLFDMRVLYERLSSFDLVIFLIIPTSIMTGKKSFRN